MRDTRDESEGPRVPLKTILQNFLNHVENLEARVREGDDAYEKEFLVRLIYCFAFYIAWFLSRNYWS